MFSTTTFSKNKFFIYFKNINVMETSTEQNNVKT